MKKTTLGFVTVVLLLALVALMVDEVHSEGDHTSYLVIAPYPTLAFSHSGGEDGNWERRHPGQPRPWYLTGKYLVLWETTRS